VGARGVWGGDLRVRLGRGLRSRIAGRAERGIQRSLRTDKGGVRPKAVFPTNGEWNTLNANDWWITVDANFNKQTGKSIFDAGGYGKVCDVIYIINIYKYSIYIYLTYKLLAAKLVSFSLS